MTEQKRIDKINAAAANHLQDVLMQIENKEIDGDDLMATTYGCLIASCLSGYNPESMIADAKTAAEKLISMAEEIENGSD